MHKAELIALIESELAAGNISAAELNQVIEQGKRIEVRAASREIEKHMRSMNLINVLYGIGGLIIISGVVVLTVQNWNDIGFIGRILVTLGISLFTFIAGLLLRKPEQRVFSEVMLTISAALAPLGSYVLLDEAGMEFSTHVQFWVALALFSLFLVAWVITKRNIVVLLIAGFATWAYYVGLFELLDFSSSSDDVIKWATMLLGFSYILTGYGFLSHEKLDTPESREKAAVTNIFYGAGSFAVLGAGITVGGFFDVLYIALLFAAFYGSVYVRSQFMLLVGALFLTIHIIKLTSAYFVDSVGWPIALIVIGFFVIGVAYMTYQLNKKYISSSE